MPTMADTYERFVSVKGERLTLVTGLGFPTKAEPSDWQQLEVVQAFASVSLCLRPWIEHSPHELLADFKQFLATRATRLRITHLKCFERIEDNFGYNQPSILFVVGRNDIPGRVLRACRTQAFLIGYHIILP